MKELEDFLTGRIWLRNFTPFSKEKIDGAINEREIIVAKGISDKLVCRRCHESSPEKIVPFQCAKCQKQCFYCRHCINMGRISSCTELISWAVPSLKPSYAHSFVWNGVLTDLQKKASNEVSNSIEKKTSHLVYAVCGAGKTELLFQPIFQALQRELRICIAAPRTDVVLELSPRIQAVFPDTIVHTLYGGSPEQAGFPNIVIATTHQLYRFENAFDVMIVDEADAFPFTYDSSLEKAVKKAAKQNAPIVYVSATPSAKLLKTIPNRSQIFRRYHQHPLPVPEFRSLWNYKKSFAKNRIPQKLADWVTGKLERKEAFLLFFPTIEMIDRIIPLFKELDPRIEAVHSKDPERKEKVMKLRNGEIPGVLTSTILERGITISNVQAAVIGAGEAIFEASALIQIAGRVGRSSDYPSGDIIFFHDGISRQMDTAKRMIKSYNEGDFS